MYQFDFVVRRDQQIEPAGQITVVVGGGDEGTTTVLGC